MLFALLVVPWLVQSHEPSLPSHPTAEVADPRWQISEAGAQAREVARGWDLDLAPSGLRVVPVLAHDAPAEDAWSFRIGTATFGRLGSARALEPGKPHIAGARAEIAHGPIGEWFERGVHGVEHGWTIPAAPEGDARIPVWIGLRLEGDLSMHITDDGSGAFLRDARGILRLRYGYLRTFDATGATIPSRISSSPWGVGIQIDASSAVYPIVVDPLIVPPQWEKEFDQAGVGGADILIDSAGDVNGDGFGDVLVAMSAWDGPGLSDEGQVWVFHGSASGPAMNPSWIGTGGAANQRFGHAASSAGDLNNDGYGDIAVTSDVIGGGSLFVYLGGPGGLGAPGTPGNADFIYAMPQAQSLTNARGSLAPVGDLDGDGYDDLALGARNETVSGFVNAGRIYVFFGGPTGIVQGPTNPWFSTPFLHTGTHFGDTLSGGDLNADGRSDLMVDSNLYSVPAGTATGRACVYYGKSSFRTNTTVDVILEPPVVQAFSYFGSCRIVGDFTGDGFADALVGAAGYDGTIANAGAIWLYPGSLAGISAIPQAFVEGDEASYLGSYIAAAGDVDGDGFADAFVSVYGGIEGPRIFHGGPAGTVLTTAHDQYLPNGHATGDLNGARVAGVGDINNDGFCDVGHAVQHFSQPETNEGKVYVHFGTPNSLASPQPGGTPHPLATLGAIQGGTSGSRFGRSVSSAGDVNADGYNDIVIGSPEFGATDNGRVQVFLGSANGVDLTSPFWTRDSAIAGERFGWSVSAGDIDNDGKSDIVVGAPRYANGHLDEGRLYLFRSLGTSIASTPSWTFESNETGALLGTSASALGDVNADGFNDIAAGAPGAMAGQGSAHVFHGRSTNLASLSAAITFSSGIPGSEFGAALALVGDVDIDGFGDLVVGAPGIDDPQVDEGRIYVYLGSYSGIATPFADKDEPHQAGARLGASIAACGDIDGDGRAEILVGAPGYDAATSGGAAFLYKPQPAGTSIALGLPSVRAGQQAGSEFGYAVSAGGDVNGDGSNDILVGAPGYDGGNVDQGRVVLYLGSSTGVAAAPSETYDGPSANARFGESIALGGDVNGDGLSDPIGGIPSANGGDGAVLIFSAGGNTALRVNCVQRRMNDFQALQILGQPSELDQFQINIGVQNTVGNTATAMGRAFARIETEHDFFDVPLDGIGSQLGAWMDTGVLGSGLRLTQPLTNLANGRAYHWRARTLVRNPYYPHTRWTTIQLNGVQEKKIGLSGDCNSNQIADAIDVDGPNSEDCNGNTIPDECDVPPIGSSFEDCNGNLVPDPCEYQLSFDCDSNGVLDECQLGNEDCNGNSVVDSCDIDSTLSIDTNGDGVPDECQQSIMAAAPFCFGDGTGAACPCANTSPLGNQDGCMNSLGLAGRLRSTGIARVAAPYDNFVLLGSAMPNSSALYFQGTAQQSGGSGLIFGDGKRCAAGSVVRLATKTNAGNASQYPTGSDSPISIQGQVPAGGGTRYYQVWYRNAAAFCTLSTFNLTNGFRVTWIP